MLREAVAEGTHRGRIAEEYMNKGELVPDKIVIGIMEERLSKPDIQNGFILDGFPRNLAQAEALDRILGNMGTSLSHVLNIVMDNEKIIERLALRRSCPLCGAIYHLMNKPPKAEGVCDECGSEIIQRSDDYEDIMRHRLEVYEKESHLLIDRYENLGLVKELKGDLPLTEIPGAICKILGNPKG
jgi:adenylate kinase